MIKTRTWAAAREQMAALDYKTYNNTQLAKQIKANSPNVIQYWRCKLNKPRHKLGRPPTKL